MNEDNAAASKEHTRSQKDRRLAERKEDATLVDAVKAGDQQAFRKLFERYHQRSYMVALGVLKNPEDARDVVQESFVKVHRYIQNFQGSSSFYTWLYRIVMNLCIDRLRRRSNKGKHAQEFREELLLPEGSADDSSALTPSRSDANPHKNLLKQELLTEIQNALNTLPEHHREVLLLREIEGLSYEEIATALEVPRGTVMSRLFHARKKMQSSLKHYVQGNTSLTE